MSALLYVSNLVLLSIVGIIIHLFLLPGNFRNFLKKVDIIIPHVYSVI